MFPLKNEASKGIPFVTITIILSCIALYFYQHGSITLHGLIPLDFVHTLFHPEMGWTNSFQRLIFAFFMHGGILHLVSNMWYLWIFGPPAEHALGTFKYFFIYLLCGIISMLLQVASAPLSDIPIVGASGAIAGIMGANLILFPMARIFLWVPPIFFIYIPAYVFLLLWFAIQYYNLKTTGDSGHGGIAWWAHIGGYLSGLAIVTLNRQKKVRKRKQ